MNENNDDGTNSFCLFNHSCDDINTNLRNNDILNLDANYNIFNMNMDFTNQFESEGSIYKIPILNQNDDNINNFSDFIPKKNMFNIYKIPSIHTYDYSKKHVLKLYKNEEVKQLNHLLDLYNLKKKPNIKIDFPYYYVRNNSVKKLKCFLTMNLKYLLINGHKNENKRKRNNRLIKKLQKVCPNEITFIYQPISERLKNYLYSEEMKKEVIEMNKRLKNKIDLTRINQNENLVDFVLNHH
jgi:hypothetical protein